jgi:hypothetical protein
MEAAAWSLEIRGWLDWRVVMVRSIYRLLELGSGWLLWRLELGSNTARLFIPQIKKRSTDVREREPDGTGFSCPILRPTHLTYHVAPSLKLVFRN